MLNGYRLFTLTHRQASLAQLEPYVLSAESRDATLTHLRTTLGWDEVFYVSTCNRALFFFYSRDRTPTSVEEFREALDVPKTAVAPIYLEGESAVLHLYDVAASVDSLVVGEREILRQLRLSYLACHEGGHCGDHLRLVMQSAVATAKQVYHETRIGQKPVSVVSLAAQRIRQHRLDAPNCRVLMVGAGQTCWLISKYLRKQGFQDVTVANRTLARAERLAASFANGRALKLTDLPTYDRGFDLLIVCTGATEPVITSPLFELLLNHELPADKVVVDLAVPHNVAVDVVERFGPQYIQIDHLRQLASDNLAFRAGEVNEARKLIGEQLILFRESVQARRVELALSHLPKQIRAVRERAMNEVFQRELSELDGETLDLIERMMHYMEKKCIGVPMKAARQAVLS